MLKKFPTNIFPILLILIVPILALWQLSFFAYTMKYDMTNQFFPCRYFISECFQNRILPLWCPYIKFGYPFYADPQGGLFYPITWLIASTLGYNAYAINVEFILHLVIGSLAFFTFLKQLKLSPTASLVFGIIYGLSGIFIGNAQHLSWIVSMAWLPFVLAQFRGILERPTIQNILLFSLGLCLMITGGYPAFVIILFYFLLFCSCYYAMELSMKKQSNQIGMYIFSVGISIVITLLLSGGYLHSFFSSLPYVDRGIGISIQQANSFPFSIHAMVSVLFPFVTTCASYEMFTDISMANSYCGVLLFPLLVLGLFKAHKESFVKIFFAYGIICAFASAGELTPVRSWMYYTLPGMKMFRHASIFRVFTVLSFLTCAAIGFDWLLKSSYENSRLAIKILFSFFALLVLIFFVSLYFNAFFFAFPKMYSISEIAVFNQKRNALSHLSAQCFLSLIFAWLLLALVMFKRFKKIRNKGISLLLILEIIFSAQLNLPCTVISNISSSDLQNRLDALPKTFPIPPQVSVNNFSHIDYGFLPIQFNTSMLRKIPAVDGYNNFQLYGMNDFTETKIYHSISNHPFAFFAQENQLQDSPEYTTISYNCSKFTPGEIDFNVDLKRKAQFVLLQSYFPGWKAFCDNEELIVNKHLQLFMSTRIPKGKHVIRFAFQPLLPKVLFWFSCLGFLTVLSTVFWLQLSGWKKKLIHH